MLRLSRELGTQLRVLRRRLTSEKSRHRRRERNRRSVGVECGRSGAHIMEVQPWMGV